MQITDISLDMLESAVGEAVFDRGVRYAREDRVYLQSLQATTARALVEGTYLYDVQVELVGRGIAASCTCPFAEDGTWCKHIVATVVVWYAIAHQQAQDHPAGPSSPVEVVDDEQLRDALSALPTEQLVDLLLGATRQQPSLRNQLVAAAGSLIPERDGELKPVDENALLLRLASAMTPVDDVADEDIPDYAGAVRAALREVNALIGAGHAPIAARLSLHAISLLTTVADEIDDADGTINDLFDLVEGIHYRASLAHPPDPYQLAAILVGRALATELRIFRTAAIDYADILGEDGLDRYSALIEMHLSTLPRQVTTHMDAQEHLEILRRYAAQALGRIGPSGEGMWERFLDQPSAYRYLQLKDATGVEFALWRDRAITVLKELTTEQHGIRDPDWSELVTALLAEGDIDGAWDAAHEGDCSEQVWLTLAEHREREHPSDTLQVLLRTADLNLAEVTRPAYRRAAGLLVHAREVAARIGAEEEIDDHILFLRHQHYRRPALQEEFTDAGLP